MNEYFMDDYDDINIIKDIEYDVEQLVLKYQKLYGYQDKEIAAVISDYCYKQYRV